MAASSMPPAAQSAGQAISFPATQRYVAAAASQEMPRLVERLRDEEALVRWRGAVALGRLGPAAAPAVMALADLLQDKEDSVRWVAAGALGAIGPAAREAATALQQTAQYDLDATVRLQAARALERIHVESK